MVHEEEAAAELGAEPSTVSEIVEAGHHDRRPLHAVAPLGWPFDLQPGSHATYRMRNLLKWRGRRKALGAWPTTSYAVVGR